MKKIYLLIIIMMSSIAAVGQSKGDIQEQYDYGSYKASNGLVVNYRMMSPDTTLVGEAHSGLYPLIVFMHGVGERGNDNKSQLENGGALFADSNVKEEFPAYVLFPQCPDEYFWSMDKNPKSQKDIMKAHKETPIMKGVIELVENCSANLPIDKKRIYIIGLSMGGLAVYDAAWRHPELFAAAVPICGAVNPERLSTINNTSFRIYHGTDDKVIPIEASEAAYNFLVKNGVDAQLIELPDVGHDSWDVAFSSPDFLSWIFSKTKSDTAYGNIPNVMASNP